MRAYRLWVFGTRHHHDARRKGVWQPNRIVQGLQGHLVVANHGPAGRRTPDRNGNVRRQHHQASVHRDNWYRTATGHYGNVIATVIPYPRVRE